MCNRAWKRYTRVLYIEISSRVEFKWLKMISIGLTCNSRLVSLRGCEDFLHEHLPSHSSQYFKWFKRNVSFHHFTCMNKVSQSFVKAKNEKRKKTLKNSICCGDNKITADTEKCLLPRFDEILLWHVWKTFDSFFAFSPENQIKTRDFVETIFDRIPLRPSPKIVFWVKKFFSFLFFFFSKKSNPPAAKMLLFSLFVSEKISLDLIYLNMSEPVKSLFSTGRAFLCRKNGGEKGILASFRPQNENINHGGKFSKEKQEAVHGDANVFMHINVVKRWLAVWRIQIVSIMLSQ